MHILVMGDLHGNLGAALNMVDFAVNRRVDKIVQVGDFGIWPGGQSFLVELDRALQKAKLDLHFVPGNHENYDDIEYMEECHERSDDGHVRVMNNVWMIPRGTVWKWEDKTWLGLGGAASIDREWRSPGVSWWPQEIILDSDVDKAIEASKGLDIDYFVSHDASNRTPWGFQLIPDPDSMECRRKIDRVLDAVKPKVHFHGHMHRAYDWNLTHGSAFDSDYGPVTEVHGLSFERERGAMGILRTETNDFEFHPRTGALN